MLPNIWTQQVYSHQGKYFNVPEREVTPKPFQKPHPLPVVSVQPG